MPHDQWIPFESEPDEVWRPVPGLEDRYRVSNKGRVVSYRILGNVARNGYPVVSLSFPDGKQKPFYVHHLVASLFIGERPPGKLVLHNDGNPENNTASNLRYGTHRENYEDSIRHGTRVRIRKTHCHKGHEFSEENTKYRSRGERICITCHTAWLKKWKEKKQHAKSPNG